MQPFPEISPASSSPVVSLRELAGAFSHALDLTCDMRILTVSGIFDALAAGRPYRWALPPEKVFTIMDDMIGCAIDIDCYAALQTAISRS